MSLPESVVPSSRLRYSREVVLSLKEVAASIDFPIQPIPTKRRPRKKSQSSETDANLIPEEGHVAEWSGGIRRIRLRHPIAGRGQSHHNHQQIPGAPSSYSRQRYPSGPDGDSGETDVITTFTPATDNRRGAQGDWSKGCAGWRQRTYSGSEGFGTNTVLTSTRGRGVTFGGTTNGEYSHTRIRGVGRATWLHRGQALRGSRRPSSFVHGPNSAENVEGESGPDPQNVPAEPSSHTDEKSSQQQSIHTPGSDTVENLATGVENIRLPPSQSQSLVDHPPPGFGLASPAAVVHSHSGESSVVSGLESETPRNQTDASWFYIDSTGQTQGPFGNEQMATWVSKGYLPLQIEVRRECDECFLPLLTHLALAGRIPFWSGYSQPPITRSNLASVLVNPGGSVPSSPWVIRPVHTEAAGVAMSAPEPYRAASLTEAHSTHWPSESSFASDERTTPLVSGPTVLSDQIKPHSTVEQSPDSSSSMGVDNELLRLCTEAQALAAHAAKVEAERQELAEKLTAISSTAAKLLSAPSQQSSSPTPSSAIPDLAKPLSGRDEERQPASASLLATETHQKGDLEVSRYPEVNQPQPNDQLLASNLQPVAADQISCSDQPHTESSDVKKNKKKNKKAKKTKLTQEQERQLAWEAELERRKRVALEHKLAQEEEEKRRLQEEAAAIAEEQAAIAKEQKRLLKEQRKQEMMKAKAESELAQLKLPQSARWAASVNSTDHNAPVGLAAIQAAQLLEEAEQRRTVDAEGRTLAKPRPNAWASVVGGDQRPPDVKAEKPVVRNPPPSNPEIPAPKTHKTEQPASRGNAKTKTTASNLPPVSRPVANDQSASVVSIWDLPNSEKNPSVPPKGKNSKKNKKNNAKVNNQKLLAAKEQLAHWCESQLSSMPLCGVDLPTVVDLLCELETADQVVEFIETSLGRSAFIGKFLKAFLEKRACVLQVVP